MGARWNARRPPLSHRAEYTGLENWRLVGALPYAVPAIMFIIQNNLVYVALSLLDPPTFQLWACWKLIPAGIFSRVRPASPVAAGGNTCTRSTPEAKMPLPKLAPA